jgi:nitrite reductase/ring-hydroxylating ferredoxin subunit
MASDSGLICASSTLDEGGAGVRFDLDVAGRIVPAFAIRYDGVVRAYFNICPHMGTELDWQPGEFFDTSALYLICATHGAVFLPDSGHCVGGPCKGSALSRVPVEERGGQIYLCKGFIIHGD